MAAKVLKNFSQWCRDHMILIFFSPKALPVFYAGSVLTPPGREVLWGLGRTRRKLLGLGWAGLLSLTQAPGSSLPSFLALSVLFCSCIESDRGLPVPWSSIVQGQELLKDLSPCLKGPVVPSEPWSFHTLAFWSCRFLQSTGLCQPTCDMVTGLGPGLVEAHFVFEVKEPPDRNQCIHLCLDLTLE